MYNFMAKGMTDRYVQYLHTENLEERGALTIYFWVMSTLESFFWGNRFSSRNFHADLYGSDNKIVLLFHAPSVFDLKYVLYPPFNCSGDKLFNMMKGFIEIFNNIKYPLSDSIPSPLFRAYDGEIKNDGEYKGCYLVDIEVDMLPEADDNSRRGV